MKTHFYRDLMIGIGLYLTIGVLIGWTLSSDLAREDAMVGAVCSNLQQCHRLYAFIIPGSAVVWPIMVVAVTSLQLSGILSVIGVTVMALYLRFVQQRQA